MVDQDGRQSDIMTEGLPHVTLSPHYAHLTGDTFKRTIHLPSMVVIVLMFSDFTVPIEEGEAEHKRTDKAIRMLTC